LNELGNNAHHLKVIVLEVDAVDHVAQGLVIELALFVLAIPGNRDNAVFDECADYQNVALGGGNNEGFGVSGKELTKPLHE
jgi:hypothetical protein